MMLILRNRKECAQNWTDILGKLSYSLFTHNAWLPIPCKLVIFYLEIIQSLRHHFLEATLMWASKEKCLLYLQSEYILVYVSSHYFGLKEILDWIGNFHRNKSLSYWHYPHHPNKISEIWLTYCILYPRFCKIICYYSINPFKMNQLSFSQIS